MLEHYVIYRYPSDYPNNYVVRRWRLVGLTGLAADKDYQLADSLGEARELVPKGLIQLDRSEGDDPCIVEVWI